MILVCEVTTPKAYTVLDVIEQVGIHPGAIVNYRGIAEVMIESVTSMVERLDGELSVWRIEYKLVANRIMSLLSSLVVEISAIGIWAPQLAYGEIDRCEAATGQRFVFAWLSKIASGVPFVQEATG